MAVSVQKFKGKLKRDIALEAFEIHGKNATREQVDKHFEKYGLKYCERSMYTAAKNTVNGKPGRVPRKYRRDRLPAADVSKIVNIVARVKQLAFEMGSYEELESLVKLLKENKLT